MVEDRPYDHERDDTHQRTQHRLVPRARGATRSVGRVGRVSRVIAFAGSRHRVSDHHDVSAVDDISAGNEHARVEA
ncbi:MAG: hypothetical protein QOE62_2302 [Actinomycetota bacterium]|jgi:hypothetical protein|nr:hypothetical protein [Actinomycetota bacterium]